MREAATDATIDAKSITSAYTPNTHSICASALRSARTITAITIPITLDGFNASLDSVAVYISGLRLTPQADYTVSGSTITLTKAISKVGTVCVIDIIKNAVQAPNIAGITALVSESAGTPVVGDATMEEV